MKRLTRELIAFATAFLIVFSTAFGNAFFVAQASDQTGENESLILTDVTDELSGDVSSGEEDDCDTSGDKAAAGDESTKPEDNADADKDASDDAKDAADSEKNAEDAAAAGSRRLCRGDR